MHTTSRCNAGLHLISTHAHPSTHTHTHTHTHTRTHTHTHIHQHYRHTSEQGRRNRKGRNKQTHTWNLLDLHLCNSLQTATNMEELQSWVSQGQGGKKMFCFG